MQSNKHTTRSVSTVDFPASQLRRDFSRAMCVQSVCGQREQSLCQQSGTFIGHVRYVALFRCFPLRSTVTGSCVRTVRRGPLSCLARKRVGSAFLPPQLLGQYDLQSEPHQPTGCAIQLQAQSLIRRCQHFLLLQCIFPGYVRMYACTRVCM